LASVNLKTSRIRVSKRLKGRLRQRVKRHMKVYLQRRRAGDSFSKAVREANRAERGKMSMREWRRHNGKLGSIARSK
jgi:hypothetical protein